MSKNSTSSWGGTRKLPYAFTETGIYMLVTVLKGDLAIARLAIQTSENTAAIAKITDVMLRRSDLPKIFKNFAPSDTGK